MVVRQEVARSSKGDPHIIGDSRMFNWDSRTFNHDNWIKKWITEK